MKYKKLLIPAAILIIFAAAAIAYFASSDQVALEADVDEKYRAAYYNCVAFLITGFDRKDVERIDLNEVSIEPLPDDYRYCSTIDGGEYYLNKKDEYWLFIFGERVYGHNFAYLVVNSQNNEVVGFIPIM